MKKIKKNKRENKKLDYSIVSVIGSVLIIIGGFFILNNFIHSKKVYAYDYMANIFFEGNMKEQKEKPKEEEKKETPEEKPEEKKEETPTYQVDYIGYLEIPKINLKKGFLDKNDSNNNVDINLYVSPTSSYPDVEKGNLIIAGHSGYGWNAFFHTLYKVNKGDYLYVTYKGKKYTYQIDNIYKQNKTGTISIYRNYEKTTLTLVTCTNDDDYSQTVYIAYLTQVNDL